MGLFAWIKNRSAKKPKTAGALFPESSWQIRITNNILYSTDWNGHKRTLDLHTIARFYVRTTDAGPWFCDVWWGMETQTQRIEIPQGCSGEEALLNFAFSLPGFEMKGMHSAENAVFDCWIK